MKEEIHLAHITASSGNSWYQLVKAETRDKAMEKLKNYFGYGYEFEICVCIE